MANTLPIAGNGLLDRRAFLRGSAALVTGYVVSPAAAEPLAEAPWSREPGMLVPRTLSDDEVYALTAYILAINKLIGEGDVMNAQTLPKVKMPNRDGFIQRFPEKM